MAKKVAKRAATVLLGVGLLAACSSGPSNNVSSPQPAAEQPPAAMPKAEGPRLFVSNEIDGTVSVIDTAQKKLIHTLKVGKRPRGIRTSADGRTVYVALSGSPIGGPNVDES